MKFNEESFKKALSECKIIRWQNIFKQVVKAYLKEDEKQLTLTDVVQQSEQYCECKKPTLGKSVSRCGTCDEWFKPLK